ncbi:MAG: hypothetical protein Q4C54_05200 [Clostridia bacterium]|nr:hypothetical protein [Clostridia bacterium]
MNDIKAIVYTSNAGHTREYARLLSEAAGIPAIDLKDAEKQLPLASEVICMGWLMAGNVQGYKQAAARYTVKAVCGVGMSRTNQEQDIRKANALPEDMPVFYLQGGYEKSRLHGLMYRMMMNMVNGSAKKKLLAKTQLTEEDKELLEMIDKGKSTVSADKLQPVLSWYRD